MYRSCIVKVQLVNIGFIVFLLYLTVYISSFYIIRLLFWAFLVHCLSISCTWLLQVTAKDDGFLSKRHEMPSAAPSLLKATVVSALQ